MAPINLGPHYRRGYVLYDTLVDCISVSANNTITPLKLGTTEGFLVYYNYYWKQFTINAYGILLPVDEPFSLNLEKPLSCLTGSDDKLTGYFLY